MIPQLDFPPTGGVVIRFRGSPLVKRSVQLHGDDKNDNTQPELLITLGYLRLAEKIYNAR